MTWFMLYSKGSVRQSRRHQALELAVIFFCLTGLYQCGLNLYLNDKSTKENGGGLLLTVTGTIFSSYGVVVCFSVASLFVSEIEWMTAMMGLIGTSFGLVLNQLLLSYTVVFLSVDNHFLDGLFCNFLDALNFPHPLCTALKLNIAGTVLLFSGLALSVLFGWLRLWEMFAHHTSASDRYHHNVHPSVFIVIRFLTFISYIGLIIETATSMKMVDEQSAAGLSVAQPLGSDYILAIAIGAAYTVGHQHGQFRFITGGCGVAGLCYISTFFINVRALHSSDAGLWCEDPKTSCTVLTSSVVAQGIIAFAQLALALIGLRFYFVKLYPDDDAAVDGQTGVSVHQRYGVPNSDGYHEIPYRSDELREPIVDQS